MTVKECYARIGSYEEASLRLGSEAYILRYLGKFRKDKSFPALCEAMEQKDPKQAFFYAHNLKGMYLNLAMTRAGSLASDLCESLRGGKLSEEAFLLLEALKEEQEGIELALSALLEEKGADT